MCNKNTFLGNVYGEMLTRTLLAARRHTVTRSFVLDYRYNNLCLDLIWSSNHFCHLSHSCNANTRLELWRLSNQPVWKVFTNYDIPSNHLISIDFRIHQLPCISPCLCNAPTCAVTLPDPNLSTCSVINRTHVSRKQAQLSHTTATLAHEIHMPPKSRAGTTAKSGANPSQPTISRYFSPICNPSARSSQPEWSIKKRNSSNLSTPERMRSTVTGIGPEITSVTLQRPCGSRITNIPDLTTTPHVPPASAKERQTAQETSRT